MTVGYRNSALGVIAKLLLMLGVATVLVPTVSWLFEIAEHGDDVVTYIVLLGLGIILGLGLLVTLMISLFYARPMLDLAVLGAAGWLITLCVPRGNFYFALSMGDFYSDWTNIVAMVGTVIAAAGSLGLAGAIALAVGPRRTDTRPPRGVPDIIGRPILVVGAICGAAISASLLISEAGIDQTGLESVGLLFALLVGAGAAVSCWRTNVLLDVSLVAATGWLVVVAGPGQSGIDMWIRSLGNEFLDYPSLVWTGWEGFAGIALFILTAVAGLVIYAGLGARFGEVTGAGESRGPAPMGTPQALGPATTGMPPAPAPTPTAPPPGWYPDPWDPAQVRWWDGAQWTHHANPARA